MNWKRIFWTLIFVLPGLALLAFGLTRDPRDIPSPLPGTAAPGFELAVLGTVAEARESASAQLPEYGLRIGDTVRLADHLGEVVVVNFWASWCLPCRDEHPELNRLALRYSDAPVQVLGVLYNDSEDNARRWLEDMGGQKFPALVDPGARTAIDYGLYGVPETFVIGPDGNVVYKHVGPVTEALLRQKIEPLLATTGGATAGVGAGS